MYMQQKNIQVLGIKGKEILKGYWSPVIILYDYLNLILKAHL